MQSHAQLNKQLARSPEELATWEAIDRDQLWPGDPGFSAAASAAGAHAVATHARTCHENDAAELGDVYMPVLMSVSSLYRNQHSASRTGKGRISRIVALCWPEVSAVLVTW